MPFSLPLTVRGRPTLDRPVAGGRGPVGTATSRYRNQSVPQPVGTATSRYRNQSVQQPLANPSAANRSAVNRGPCLGVLAAAVHQQLPRALCQPDRGAGVCHLAVD